jgi:predicted TPR repeat methyltransferase
MLNIYQDLYNNHNYCNNPIKAVKSFISVFKIWLKGKIIDLGCGRGLYVNELRKLGFNIDGIDFIKLNNDMKTGNITKQIDLSKYNTCICLDVFEHLKNNEVIQVLKNMQQTQHQVIHVNNESSYINCIELHINRKPYIEWQKLISEYLEICKPPLKKGWENLFFCKSYA